MRRIGIPAARVGRQGRIAGGRYNAPEKLWLPSERIPRSRRAELAELWPDFSGTASPTLITDNRERHTEHQPP